MEHKEFEAELKKRRKDFSEDLEMYAAQVEAFHSIGATDIVRRDQVRGEKEGVEKGEITNQVRTRYKGAWRGGRSQSGRSVAGRGRVAITEELLGEMGRMGWMCFCHLYALPCPDPQPSASLPPAGVG